MKAAILHGIRDIRIEDVEKPAVGPGEALVRVRAVGVCGSDVHYYLNGRIGTQVVRAPHILGHEAAGEVVEVGEGVKNLSPGTRVAIEPGIPCGRCEHCKRGRNNICPDVKFLGTPPVGGAYREYISFPADFLYPLPDSISFAEGALIEPLAVGMYAVELAELRTGDDIAVLGCGPVGIATLKVAQAQGAGRVFVTDIVDERLAFARKQGGVVALHAEREEPIEKISRAGGVDIVFEAAGEMDTIRQSVEVVRIGGRVIWIGIPSEDSISIDPHIARHKELVIKAVRRSRHNYERCIRQVELKNIVVKDMITHEFNLEDVAQAFELVEKYADGVIKAIINI